MRTLTSVQSATDVLLDINLEVTAADASTTWLFDRDSVQSYPAPEWEIDYLGGLGKTSTYEITLASSIGFLSENFQKLNRAQTYLKVYVNSDVFVPHVGRIRAINREAHNPNIFSFKVYEDFLDGDPYIPLESIQDSYSTVHPQLLQTDYGYPLYYGKHTRPFYMTPVDCNIDVLLGPRNVSSENHTTTSFRYIVNDTEFTYLLDNWDQQSGGTNTTSAFVSFEVRNLNQTNDFFMRMQGAHRYEDPRPSVYQEIQSENLAANTQEVHPYTYEDQSIGGGGTQYIQRHNFQINIERVFDVKRATRGKWMFDFYFKPNSNYHYSDQFYFNSSLLPFSGNAIKIDSIFVGSYSFVDSAPTFLTEDTNSYFRFSYGENTGASSVKTYSRYVVVSLDVNYQLLSKSFFNYSIFGIQVNCSDIAISENPNGIIADIINQTSYQFQTAQNSTAQSETTSYAFQCFFGERQPLSDILQEFGAISGTYYWIGDSGFINTRTYQESSIVTNSIDVVVTPNDIIQDTLTIKDNPLGFIFYQTEKAARLRVDYRYDFVTGNYQDSMIVDRTNNTFCQSAYNAGIQKEKIEKTKYILESQTTSYYIDNLIRKYTTDDNVIEGWLPARFMGLELCDIIKVQHPSLLNSESLFQVTKIQHNYDNGQVKFLANEIKNIL